MLTVAEPPGARLGEGGERSGKAGGEDGFWAEELDWYIDTAADLWPPTRVVVGERPLGGSGAAFEGAAGNCWAGDCDGLAGLPGAPPAPPLAAPLAIPLEGFGPPLWPLVPAGTCESERGAPL